MKYNKIICVFVLTTFLFSCNTEKKLVMLDKNTMTISSLNDEYDIVSVSAEGVSNKTDTLKSFVLFDTSYSQVELKNIRTTSTKEIIGSSFPLSLNQESVSMFIILQRADKSDSARTKIAKLNFYPNKSENDSIFGYEY